MLDPDTYVMTLFVWLWTCSYPRTWPFSVLLSAYMSACTLNPRFEYCDVLVLNCGRVTTVHHELRISNISFVTIRTIASCEFYRSFRVMFQRKL